MDKLVLDTDILIDHVHGHARWLDDLLHEGRIKLIIPTIVVAEYHTAQELETAEGLQSSRAYLSSFQIQDLTQPIAEALGTILRQKSYASGASIPDLIIAATALTIDAPLATRNATHFRGIAGLRFFNPKEREARQ